MSDYNFRCKKCGEDFFVRKYRHAIIDGELSLVSKHECDHCGSGDVEEIPEPNINWSEGGPLNIHGKFSSASDEKKKQILKARSKTNYHQKGREQKREFFKSTVRNFRKSNEE